MVLPSNINDLINIHKGQTGFIIGGGYSIKQILENQSAISFINEHIVIGTNKAYKFFDLDYLVCCDPHFWKNYKHEIKNLETIKFCPSIIKNVDEVKNLHKFNIKHARTVPSDFNLIKIENNTGVAAIRIGYLLGLNEIYLLGFDLCKVEVGNEKIKNFHDGYDKEREEKVTDDKLQEHYEEIRHTINEITKLYNIKFYSCCEYSPLNNDIPVVEIDKEFP